MTVFFHRVHVCGSIRSFTLYHCLCNSLFFFPHILHQTVILDLICASHPSSPVITTPKYVSLFTCSTLLSSVRMFITPPLLKIRITFVFSIFIIKPYFVMLFRLSTSLCRATSVLTSTNHAVHDWLFQWSERNLSKRAELLSNLQCRAMKWWGIWGKSLTWIRNKRRPRMLPWSTPILNSQESVLEELAYGNWSRYTKHEVDPQA